MTVKKYIEDASHGVIQFWNLVGTKLVPTLSIAIEIHPEKFSCTNATIKNLGPTLMQLTSTAVYRCAPQDDPAVVFKGSPIRSLTQGDYLVGAFRHNDGRRAALLNNYHFEIGRAHV